MSRARGLVNVYPLCPEAIPGKGKIMNQRSFALLAAFLLLSPLMTGLACAQTTAAPTAAPASATPAATASTGQQHSGTLVVLNAKGAQLQGKALSLDGVSASAILFADRPIRRAGYMHTGKLVKLWSGGTFAKDPPNATISAFTKDGARLADAVVVLKSPRMEGDKLTFDVTVLEGSLNGADGPASMFIDAIWFGVGGKDGVNYIGRNQTTGGTAPAFGSKDDTSNPGGWPNPAPNGAPRPTTSPPPTNAAPLATPPAGSH